MNDNLCDMSHANHSLPFNFKCCRAPSKAKRVLAVIATPIVILLPGIWIMLSTPEDLAPVAIGGFVTWIIIALGAMIWFLLDKHPAKETVKVNQQAIESKGFGVISFDDIKYIHVGGVPIRNVSVRLRNGEQHTWTCSPFVTDKQDATMLRAFVSALQCQYGSYRGRTPIRLPLTYRFRFNDTHWLRPVALSVLGFLVTLMLISSTLKSSFLSAAALLFWIALASWCFLRHSNRLEIVTLEDDHLMSRAFGTIQYRAIRTAEHTGSSGAPQLTLFLHSGQKVMWNIMAPPPAVVSGPVVIPVNAAGRQNPEISAFIAELKYVLASKNVEIVV